MQKQQQSKGLTERKTPNILVVCHGNICRSPLAGALLIRELGTDYVRDRGLKAHEGAIAAKKVREFASGLEIDLSMHRARCTTLEDVKWANLVLYMDNANRERLQGFPDALEKARCLAEWAGLKRIPDPNYMRGDSEEFREVMQLIVTACQELVESVRNGSYKNERSH